MTLQDDVMTEFERFLKTLMRATRAARCRARHLLLLVAEIDAADALTLDADALMRAMRHLLRLPSAASARC